MANITKTIADTAGFVPEIWGNRALEVLRANIVMARVVAKDTDIAAFNRGDVLHIPYPGTFTANDKAADGAVTLQTPTGGTDTTVTLNKHKEVSFIVEDAARAQADQDILDRYVQSAVVAIAEQIEADLLAEHANVTTTVGTAGTDLTASTVRAARKALNDAKAPLQRRNLVIASKDEISILGDANLQSYFANSRPEGVAEGSIGRAYGFDIYMSHLVPVVAGATKNLAFNSDAFLLAMRGLPEPPAESGARATTLKDPRSGLVIRVLYGYNMSYLGVQVTLDALYGVKTIRAAKAVKVHS